MSYHASPCFLPGVLSARDEADVYTCGILEACTQQLHYATRKQLKYVGMKRLKEEV